MQENFGQGYTLIANSKRCMIQILFYIFRVLLSTGLPKIEHRDVKLSFWAEILTPRGLQVTKEGNVLSINGVRIITLLMVLV
jgi:hypothetical protein